MIQLHYSDINIKKKQLCCGGTLSFHDCGIIGVKGMNGCGKTLLLRNILYCNQDVKIQYVSQESGCIFSRLSVLENITMCDQAKIEVARSFLHYMKSDYLEFRDVRTLSGGEQRIVSLGRALLSDAKVLMLDEPTNDLGYDMVQPLIDLISSEAKKRAFLIVTHDDRLNNLFHGLYCFHDAQLLYMEGNEERLNESVIQTIDISSNELANASIKTIVQREWRLIVFGIFLCVFFAYYLYQSLSFLKCDVQVDTYDDNRCDLFFIGTTISYAKVQTSFPLFLYSFLKDETNYGNIIKRVKQYNSDLIYASNDNSLSALNEINDICDVIYLEFGRTDCPQYIRLEEIYRQLFYPDKDMIDLKLEGTCLSHTNNTQNSSDNEIIFEYEKYCQCLEKLCELPYEVIPTYAVVYFKEGYSIRDIIADERLKKISQNDAILFQSNEGNMIYIAIEEYRAYISSLMSVMLGIAIFVLLELAYSLLYHQLHMMPIVVLRNYGIHLTDLKKTLSIHLRKIEYHAVLLLFIISTISMIILEKKQNILRVCMLITTVFCFAYLNIIVNRIALYIRLELAYNWKCRR